MKDISYIVKLTAKQMNLPENVVNAVIRSATEDMFDFMSKKEGYSILFPKVGRFEFNVIVLDKYIQKKRLTKASYTVISQSEGINKRTMFAATRNIEQSNYHIRKALEIGEEFKATHAKYYKKKREAFYKNNSADISRLEEYLDISAIAQDLKDRNKISTETLRTMRTPDKDS